MRTRNSPPFHLIALSQNRYSTLLIIGECNTKKKASPIHECFNLPSGR